MAKKQRHLKPVPPPAQEPPTAQPPPAVSPQPRILTCPAPARAILKKRVEAVRVAQEQLKETADAIAAGLGIDLAKEQWVLDADHGVFIRKS